MACGSSPWSEASISVTSLMGEHRLHPARIGGAQQAPDSRLKGRSSDGSNLPRPNRCGHEGFEANPLRGVGEKVSETFLEHAQYFKER